MKQTLYEYTLINIINGFRMFQISTTCIDERGQSMHVGVFKAKEAYPENICFPTKTCNRNEITVIVGLVTVFIRTLVGNSMPSAVTPYNFHAILSITNAFVSDI